MKQCPFCGASLQDDARFCLFCMRPLEEKERISDPPLRHGKRWILIAAAIAVFLAVGLFILLRRPPVPAVSDPPVTDPSAESGTSTTDGGMAFDGTKTTAPSRSASVGGTTAATEPPASTATTNSAATTRSTTTTNSTTTAKPSTTTTAKPSTTTTAKTTSTTAADTAVYQYRAAKSGDDNYAVHTAFSDDAIVITGISKPAADGVYRIPETVDGKRVVAIMAYAFNAKSICATVKKVVLPPSVKSVWAGAFSACIHLTDIYFSADVYIDPAAFAPKGNRTGTLTIHCPPSCTDRNFYKYSRTAADYDAVYAEWNGGAL